MAWLSGGFGKRKKVTLTGGSSGAQTDYQMKFTVAYDSDMQVDFDDLRFTKLDGTTLLDAWLESKVDSTSAVVWVETDTPANTVEADIYMYYGNSGAASDWDGISTFVGHFFGGDSTGWTEVDPATYLAFANGRLDYTNVPRNVDTYVYKSITGINQFHASFEGQISGTSGSPNVSYFVMADEIDDSKNITNGLTISQDATQTYINRYINNVRTISGTIPNQPNSMRWWDFYIDGNTAYLKVYSDAARTSQIGSTQSIDVSGLTISNLIYLYPFSSFNSGHTPTASGLVDDLIVRKYAANPATYAFGGEESEGGTTMPIFMSFRLRQKGV